MLRDSLPSDLSGVASIATASELAIDPARRALARKKIAAMNMTIGQWAEKEGYSARLVYKILQGGSKCLYGTSLEIANKLGLRDPQTPIA